FIQDQLASRHLKMRPDFGRRLLSRGNLLFLLDGLDEVADLAQREEVFGWIEEAFTDYPDCRFVVTCRFAGYSPSVRMGEKFLEMHVRPLSEEEAERFVRSWYAIVEKSLAKDVDQAESIAREKSDHLIERLREPDFRARRVFELTRNPLLLTNICLVHRHRGSLPKRRARLYEECIDVLLEHWRGAKKLELGVNALQGRMALQPAALWLHGKKGRIRATAEELAPHIEPALKKLQWKGGDARDFLNVIQNESGLLTGWDHENYGFMHLGFQEYLAAREIRTRFQREMIEDGRSEMLKDLAGRFGESWWREVALLLLALEDPPLFTPYMREVVRLPAFARH
ncbi:MAG: NACHT domain-containing protein, partial [Desulfobacterales bacterium]|nr:NACHT domain-containing protein [Desulfobacterales bacterium]